MVSYCTFFGEDVRITLYYGNQHSTAVSSCTMVACAALQCSDSCEYTKTKYRYIYSPIYMWRKYLKNAESSIIYHIVPICEFNAIFNTHVRRFFRFPHLFVIFSQLIFHSFVYIFNALLIGTILSMR